jgi:hypothetical protein
VTSEPWSPAACWHVPLEAWCIAHALAYCGIVVLCCVPLGRQWTLRQCHAVDRYVTIDATRVALKCCARSSMSPSTASSKLTECRMRTSAGGEGVRADIMMRGDNVEDAVRLLHEVCDRMDGSIQPQFTLKKSSIRMGMNAAVAEVTTRFGTEVTVAFFPDKSRKAKQLRMYGRNATKDFMPIVSEAKDPFMHTYASVPSLIPAMCGPFYPAHSPG